MVKQLLLFDKQKLQGHISLRKGKDVSLRVSRLYIVRNCMNWNFISVPSVIRCTLRFFLFFLFRGDSSSPRYVKKNSQELSFIIKLRHRFSLIRKLINWPSIFSEQRNSHSVMMYGLKWNVVSHSSPASVPCSAFRFFLFFFFRWGWTISSSKKSEELHYFPTRENCFQVQLNLSPTATEEEIEDITWPRRDTNFIFEC